MGLDVERSYARSIRADMARAQREVVARVGGPEAAARIGDHRAGMHDGKADRHELHCWACRALGIRGRRR